MIYLTACNRVDDVDAVTEHTPYIGYMQSPEAGVRSAILNGSVIWAADNGCYSQGERFDLDRYYRWLERMKPAADRCLFATAPDVVGDAAATWRRSVDVLPVLRAMGYRAALVGQDGAENLDLDWSAFDALFVGGTTEWKLSESAYELAAEAKRRGKWIHMGRVNSRRRFMAAAVSGYDSADGTHVAFGPDRRLPEIIAWSTTIRQQSKFIV